MGQTEKKEEDDILQEPLQDQGASVVGQPVGYVPMPPQEPMVNMFGMDATGMQNMYNPNMFMGQHYQMMMPTVPDHQVGPAEQTAEVKKPRVSKRNKSPEEIAAQEEKVKKRRRESAQRSRQRKSAYLKNLECENHALKLENERLRKALAKQNQMLKGHDNSTGASSSSLNVALDEQNDATGEGFASSFEALDSSMAPTLDKSIECPNNTAAEILGFMV